jgi:hypothetical protein
MTKLRTLACATAVATLMVVPPAFAQSATAKNSNGASTTDQVKTWTQKKWNAMKAEWRKDKAKWDSCNQQATDKKLSGRKSWSFIYDCMKA